MRTILVLLTLLVLTPILGTIIIVAGLLGVRDRAGGVFDVIPSLWCRAILRAAGVKVVLHGAERLRDMRPYVYASNHVSWFDIFVLASFLPRYKFVAKAELFKIPIFGRAAKAAGQIPITRDNRKAAFRSYEVAAERIRAGASVVVFPEGTRGFTYELRPFKKGPFVLAAAAGVPLVPTILHGTLPIQPKGSYRIRSGRVDVHFLTSIDTIGSSYDDRDRLARECWERMAAALRDLYGVESTAPTARPLVEA
jgi:1-acyl-sn-glycerol-3-phosphate acyltransferase